MLSHFNPELLGESIIKRWGIIDYDRFFPWWRQPANVRLLMYADGGAQFNGGPFLGLTYVIQLLKSRPYFYVDFEIDTAHRDGSPGPDIVVGGKKLANNIAGAKKLTDLDILSKYDEVWFFGVSSTPRLDPAEVTLLDQFMAAPKQGGVLVTGDHASLGRGIAGQITRAGQMRQYPAPDAIAPIWNTTLVEGPDPGTTYDFDDQSDDTPQTIRWKRYRLSSGPIILRRYRPHPVLCGPQGPIVVFPDHQHEGAALELVPAPGDPKWPTKAGRQERPEVIAWGTIKDPAAVRHGQEIGLASAYDGHNVDVGRILADSTWHHWFDINLTGRFAPPSPYAGFDATPAGQQALQQIDAYFLNCGVWLAPPNRQQEMRNAAWWSVLWTDQVLEIPLATPIWYWGEQAIDALGRRATRCTVSEWIFLEPIFKAKIPKWEWPQLFERFELVDLPFERYVAGGILRHLVREIGPAEGKRAFPQRAPEDAELNKLITSGTEEGLGEMSKLLHAEAQLTLSFVEAGLRLEL